MTTATSRPPRVCMIVNKSAGRLGPSETFLRAHATLMPGETLSLVGNPGRRRIGIDGGPHLIPRNLATRGLRWALTRIAPGSAEAWDARAVRRYLESERVDVVLAEYGPTAVSVRAACVGAGVPLVAHFHGWDAYVLPRRPHVLAEYHRLFADATAIIAVSRHMVRQLVSLGAPEDKVHWNPCGAAVPESASRPAEAPQLFVAVGRFTPKKAPRVTLAAFARVAEELPEARLEMIGSGPLLEDARELAERLGIQERVTFHGAAAHEKVFETLSRARCFVQHSVMAPDGDREGTPVAVLEAMALGLPVVATRHTGIMDVIDEGVTGTLVDEFDEEGMAEAMLSYARDPARTESVGRAARESVRQDWSMARSIARLWEIVRNAASTTRPG